MNAATYWTLSGVLVVFGFLTGFSIGMPFLLIGVTLLALGPARHNKVVFWPVLIAVIGFIVGFILVTPLSCTTSSSVRVVNGNQSSQPSTTQCTNILGIDYSGTGLYNPSQQPALLAGFGLGAIAGGTLFVTLRSNKSRTNDG